MQIRGRNDTRAPKWVEFSVLEESTGDSGTMSSREQEEQVMGLEYLMAFIAFG